MTEPRRHPSFTPLFINSFIKSSSPPDSVQNHFGNIFLSKLSLPTQSKLNISNFGLNEQFCRQSLLPNSQYTPLPRLLGLKCHSLSSTRSLSRPDCPGFKLSCLFFHTIFHIQPRVESPSPLADLLHQAQNTLVHLITNITSQWYFSYI